MPKSMDNVRQTALENVAEAARNLERVLSSTNHPGIDNERMLATDALKKCVHELDEIDGARPPVGKTEKWQEEMAGPK
jgi:hypothetical protein